jgi:hypothetical protein
MAGLFHFIDFPGRSYTIFRRRPRRGLPCQKIKVMKLILTVLLLAVMAPVKKGLLVIAPLHEKRAAHSAVVLPGGKVLIIAGFKKGPDTYSQLYSATTEIFDPATYHFTYSGSLHIARCGQTATLLNGGKEVLITGGNNDRPHLASAELYDVASGQWTRLPDMHAGREGHQAVLLNNGKVLIIGGTDDARNAMELYNPATRQFEQGPTAPVNCSGTVITLGDGRILIAGGSEAHQLTNKAMVYDPASNHFTRVGDLSIVRYKTAAALLPDGRAILIGGSDNRDWNGKYNSTELFDPKTNKFTPGPDLNFRRFKLGRSLVTLPNGDILVAGGDQHIEQWHDGKFSVVATLSQPCYFTTASPLPRGAILLAGGYGNDAQCIDKAWVYIP